MIPDTLDAYKLPLNDETGFAGAGSYLSCLGENVGVRKSEGLRLPQAVPPLPVVAKAPSQGGGPTSLSSSAIPPAPQMVRSRSGSLVYDLPGRSYAQTNDEFPPTNDGGKVVKRNRRANSSSSSPLQPPSLRGRRRGASLTALQSDASQMDISGSDTESVPVWTQDAGEAGVWTIASTGEAGLSSSSSTPTD